MGREANCHCQWADEAAECKVLIETHEVIVRGAIRRRAAIASLTDISVHGGQLRFCAGGDTVALDLGEAIAQSWAKKLTTPPPTLAAKLGISAETRLLLIGEFESEELKSAIAATAITESKDANLILASLRTNRDLNYALDRYAAHPGKPPIWMIYPKGPNKPLTETEIRDTLRREGLIDTKVASVSPTLTALRFIKRS